MLVAGTAMAQTGASSLVRKSPFLPPQFNPPGEAGAEAALPASRSRFEFRGVYQLGGRYYYHLFDQGSGRGEWLSQQNQAAGSPRIVEFKQNPDRLVIDVDGRVIELEMASRGDQSLPAERVTRASHSGQATVDSSGNDQIRRPVIRSANPVNSGGPTRRVTFSEPLTSN